MKKVNLRDLYPDVYKNDHFVEVTEDVLETIRAAERAEAAYDRRMYRYKIGSDYFLCWSFSTQNQIPCAGSFGCQRIHVILKAR